MIRTMLLAATMTLLSVNSSAGQADVFILAERALGSDSAKGLAAFTLDFLVNQHSEARLIEDAGKRGQEVIVLEAGTAVRLVGVTPSLVATFRNDPRYRGVCSKTCEARIMDGRSAGRTIFLPEGKIEGASKPQPVKAPDIPAPVAPVKEPLSEMRGAEILKGAKSAIAAARSKGARREPAVRKRAIAAETEAALKALTIRFAVDREQLDAIIAEGERADGTAARKSATSATLSAKANVRDQLEQVNVAQLRATSARTSANPYAGLRPSDAAALNHAMSGNPNPLPSTAAVYPFRDVAGSYRIESGRKIYQAR